MEHQEDARNERRVAVVAVAAVVPATDATAPASSWLVNAIVAVFLVVSSFATTIAAAVICDGRSTIIGINSSHLICRCSNIVAVDVDAVAEAKK